jgi:hypothetical protein
MCHRLNDEDSFCNILKNKLIQYDKYKENQAFKGVGKYAEVKVQWGAKFLTGIVLKKFFVNERLDFKIALIPQRRGSIIFGLNHLLFYQAKWFSNNRR